MMRKQTENERREALNREPNIVAYFRQDSAFGPWIECTPREPGAIRFEAEIPAHKRPSLQNTR